MAQYEHLPIYQKAMAFVRGIELRRKLKVSKLAKLIGAVLLLSSVTAYAGFAGAIVQAQVFNPGPGATDPNYPANAPYQNYQDTQWPSPRFTVGTGTNADCVTDNLTGLVWVRDLSTVSNTPVIFTTAQTTVVGLTLCGYNNWRLPTVTELRSLVNYAVTSSTGTNLVGWFSSQGFSNVQANKYWTGTNVAAASTTNWVVDMGSTTTTQGAVNGLSEGSTAYIWPVAGGN